MQRVKPVLARCTFAFVEEAHPDAAPAIGSSRARIQPEIVEVRDVEAALGEGFAKSFRNGFPLSGEA